MRILSTVIGWLGRSLGNLDWANLPAMAPQLQNDPLQAMVVGLVILCTLGWAAYQQYQEVLQSRQLEKIEDYLRRLDQAHFVTLRDAANKLHIDSQSGRIDFGQISEHEGVNPHIILFKLLTECVDRTEDQIQQTLGSLSQEIRGQLTLLLFESDELERQLAGLAGQQSREHRQIRQEIGQLLEEIRQAKTEIAAEVASYFQWFEAQFREQHRPPLYVPLFTDEEQRRMYRYLPGSRWVSLTGRDQEFEHLRAFLESDARLKWHLVVGSGGQGKSRLALELILYAHEQGWRAGFFRRHTSYSDWHQWNPERDTLIVFDYASLQAETIQQALLALHEKTRQENCPRLRVLLLERYLDERAQWFKTLIATDSNHDRSIIESHYHQPPRLSADAWRPSAHAGIGALSGEMYAPLSPSRLFETIQPYRLQPLQEDHFLQLMYEYYLRYGQPTQAVLEREQLRDALQALPEGDYRPLFAAFAAEAIAEQGIEAVRRWNAQELVKWVLDRDYAQWQQRKIDQKHANLVAFATVVGGLSIEEATTLGREHPRLFPDIETEFVQEHYNALTAYTHSESDDRLVGILPDLLGELFILERLGNNYQLGMGLQRARNDTEQIIRLAWKYIRQTEGAEQHPITAFILRCAGDFPDHSSLQTLLRIQPEEKEKNPIYHDTLVAALTRLTTDGSQNLFGEMLQQLPSDKQAMALVGRGLAYAEQNRLERAIEDCSEVIEMIDAPAALKAQALFTRGAACVLQGDTEQAIEDCSVVINEMSDAPAALKAQALLVRGGAYGLQEKREQAIADFTAVIEMPNAPDELKAQTLLTLLVYGLQERWERAIADWSEVIEMPDAPAALKAQARVNRGAAYGEQGDMEREIEDFTAVIEMPNAPAALKASALFGRGAAYGLQEKWEQAIADFTAVIEMPEQWEQAIADFTAVIEMPVASDELKAQARVARGVAYGLQEKREQAIADFTAVIEMPNAPAELKHMAKRLLDQMGNDS